MQASYGRKPSGTFAAGKPQASAEAAQAAEEAEMKKATLQAYERALEELKIKTETQRGFVGANTQKLAEWKEKVADYQGGMDCALPVFPVGAKSTQYPYPCPCPYPPPPTPDPNPGPDTLTR